MSEPAEQPGEQPRGRRRFRMSYLLIPLVLLLAAAVILELIPANEYVLLPGDALPVAPMISIPKHPAHHKRGQLYLTDVSLFQANHLLEALWGRLNPNADTEPASTVSGGLSNSQFNQLNQELMSDSIHAAEYAALSTIPGLHPHFARTGPRIFFVLPNTPASHVIHVGDVVLAVDGHRTRRANSVAPYVKPLKPGSIVRLRIMRGGKQMYLRVPTVPATDGQPTKNGKQALVGIELQDQVIFPLKIAVRPGAIGGPSAGLMFTLGIIQRLLPRDITKGCRIAGTGTMDFSGTVGAIGGAKQKIIAARAAGVKYFFVPDVPDNRVPAMANRGSVTVVPVKTLGQALNYLKHIKPCR